MRSSIAGFVFAVLLAPFISFPANPVAAQSASPSTFCASNPAGAPGELITLTAPSFTFDARILTLHSGEMLTFRISQTGGNPSSLPGVRITTANALAPPSGEITDQTIPASSIVTATLTLNANVNNQTFSFFLSGSGVPASGVPLVATIDVTCTPASGSGSGGGSGGSSGSSTSSTPSSGLYKANINKEALRTLYGGPNASSSFFGGQRAGMLLKGGNDSYEALSTNALPAFELDAEQRQRIERLEARIDQLETALENAINFYGPSGRTRTEPQRLPLCPSSFPCEPRLTI